MRLWCVFIIIFIVFSGCSTKDVNPLSADIQEKKLISNEDFIDDELFYEFEDDTEIKKVYDPFSVYNRAMTHFNDKLYVYILTPIAKGYSVVIPYEARKCFSNLFNNLQYPTRVVNNLLQMKVQNASEETGRFVINSTIGILGLFDPAKHYFNLEAHAEDFGQTLGFYGVGSGPYLVLPLFGPSNLRDAIGIMPDSYLSPIDYTDREWFTLTDTWASYLSVRSYDLVNKFSLDVNQYEKLKEDSIDLYPYFRTIYEQHRNKLIQE